MFDSSRVQVGVGAVDETEVRDELLVLMVLDALVVEVTKVE